MSESWPPGWDPKWALVGKTSNTDYYVDHEGVLLALPHPGSHDTGATARENFAFQKRHYQTHDDPPIVAIFFDRMASQDREARTIYSSDPSAQWALGFALIGGSMLSRAMGSFFLGLSRPQAPLKFFPSLAQARPWIRTLQQQPRDR